MKAWTKTARQYQKKFPYKRLATSKDKSYMESLTE